MADNNPQKVYEEIFKKPKYDTRLIGRIARNKGSIREVAEKYGVSKYFVQQSRRLAREYGYRVKGDRLSDGERELILNGLYEGKSAGEISKTLGGVSTSTINKIERNYINGLSNYFGESLSNSVKTETDETVPLPSPNSDFSTENLEAKVVGRKDGIVQICIKRRQVVKSVKVANGGSVEIEGYNVLDARNEATGGESGDLSFSGVTDDALKRDYGMNPTIVRRGLAYLKKQMIAERETNKDLPEVTDESVIEVYDRRRFNSLGKQIQTARECKTGNPKGSISILEHLLNPGVIPNKQKFAERRQETEDALAFVKKNYATYLAEEAAKKAAAEPAAQSPAELSTFVNGKPVGPETPAVNAPEAPAPAKELLLVSPVGEPGNDDRGEGEPAQPPAGAQSTESVEVDPRAIEIVGRRYVNPDMAVVAKAADEHGVIVGDEDYADIEAFFKELDSKLERKEATDEDFEKANALNRRYNVRASWLHKVISDGQHATTQTERKNEIDLLNKFINGMDSEGRDELYTGLVKEAYKRREKVIHACTPLGRAEGWCDRNYKYLLTAAALGVAGVALWAGMRTLEDRIGTVEERQGVPSYVSIKNNVEDNNKSIRALEGRANANDATDRELKARQSAFDDALNKARADLEKADRENLKTVKGYVDDIDEKNRTAHRLLDEERAKYDKENDKTDKDLRTDVDALKKDVKKLGEKKEEPKIGPKPGPEPIPNPPVGPSIGPEPNPNPAPKQAEKEKEPNNLFSMSAGGFTGDMSGHQERARLDVELGENARLGIDFLNRSSDFDLSTGESRSERVSAITPELTLRGDNYKLRGRFNHAEMDESLDGNTRTVTSGSESGIDWTQTDLTKTRETSERRVNLFDFSGEAGNVLFGAAVSSDRTSVDNRTRQNTNVALSGGLPPINLDNRVDSSTERDNMTERLELGYRFKLGESGLFEPTLIYRHSDTDTRARASLNGSSILDERDSFSTDSFGGSALYRIGDFAARGTLLNSSGDEVEGSARTEGALHGVYGRGNIAGGLGFRKAGGSNSGSLVAKFGEDASSSVGIVEQFMTDRERAELFPEGWLDIQRFNARQGSLMKAGEKGAAVAVEGGEFNGSDGKFLMVGGATNASNIPLINRIPGAGNVELGVFLEEFDYGKDAGGAATERKGRVFGGGPRLNLWKDRLQLGLDLVGTDGHTPYFGDREGSSWGTLFDLKFKF